MKKLFLFLGVGVLAMAAQAIQLQWTTPVTSWTPKVKTGALIYTTQAQEAVTASVADIANFAKGTTATLDDTFENLTNTSGHHWAISEGVDNWVSATNNPTERGTYYLVLFDSTKDKYAVASFAASATDGYWVGAAPMESMDSFAIATEKFSGTLVPEPTVLALLALGVAGVALRRKA